MESKGSLSTGRRAANRGRTDTTVVTAGDRAAPIATRLAAAGLPPVPRLAWVEIDLGALAANARALRRTLPLGTALGLVVKADGYGHGLLPAALAAVRAGASLLVVATLDEAVALRDAGVMARILVTYPVPGDLVGMALAARIDVVAADEDSLAALVDRLRSSPSLALRQDRSAARVHLAARHRHDAGGLRPDRVAAAAGRLIAAGLPRLAGTWSHLATPEDPAAVAARSTGSRRPWRACGRAGIEPGIRHLDATGGVVGAAAQPYDLARVGLAFYGLLPPGPALAGRSRPSGHAAAGPVAACPRGPSHRSRPGRPWGTAARGPRRASRSSRPSRWATRTAGPAPVRPAGASRRATAYRWSAA